MTDPLWYYETAAMHGWCPNTSIDKPTAKDGHLATVNGKGPRIRRIIEVPESHRHMTLAQKQAAADEYFGRVKG